MIIAPIAPGTMNRTSTSNTFAVNKVIIAIPSSEFAILKTINESIIPKSFENFDIIYPEGV